MNGGWPGPTRFGDVVDVLVVAVFVYLILNWLWKTRYRRLGLALVVLAASVVVARVAQLYLTLLFLQIVLVVLGAALIVVFQEEIRRTFERLAATSGRARETESLGLVQETVEAAFAMANKRIGAIMVFEGREPLERFVSAGIGIEARVSSVLLQSIFEPRSPGHDGAALIVSGRLSQFAVHLPLAQGPARDVSGTRHAAALGIAQKSDALALVVSEEHGDVSIAKDGRLARVDSPDELAEHLAHYLRGSERPSAPPRLRVALRAAVLSVLALATAGVLWELFADRTETLQRTYEVRIEYRNAPENLLLDPPDPPMATVMLSGAARDVALVDPDTLALGIDASGMTPGRQNARLSPDTLALPLEVAVVAVEPEQVVVVARELVATTLPVVPQMPTAADSDLDAVVVEPSEISVWLPRSLVDSIEHLETESLDLARLREARSLEVSVLLPEGARPRDGEAVVRVRFN